MPIITTTVPVECKTQVYLSIACRNPSRRKIVADIYRLDFVPLESTDVATAAFRLTSATRQQESYDIFVGRFGPECTCGDWVFRRSRTDLVCKHIRALQDARYIRSMHEMMHECQTSIS